MKTTLSASQSSYFYLRTPKDMILTYVILLKKKMKIELRHGEFEGGGHALK